MAMDRNVSTSATGAAPAAARSAPRALGAISAGLWTGLGAEMLGAAKEGDGELSLSPAGGWHGATDRPEAGFPGAGAAPGATDPSRRPPSVLPFIPFFFLPLFSLFLICIQFVLQQGN